MDIRQGGMEEGIKVSTDVAVVGMNTELLFTKALEKDASVETLERLMAVRRELRNEFAETEFFRALSAFQSRCPAIRKTKSVMNKGGTSVRFKFAPLDEIVSTVKSLLKECGFSYSLEVEQNKETVTAICVLHHEAGHSAKTSFTVPIDPEGFMTAPQKVASALTYAKRYAFCNATGIMTADEDDDGMAAGRSAANMDDIVALENIAEDMDENGKKYIYDQIAKGLTTEQARKILERAKNKVVRR